MGGGWYISLTCISDVRTSMEPGRRADPVVIRSPEGEGESHPGFIFARSIQTFAEESQHTIN
jgi:hypothetical protein